MSHVRRRFALLFVLSALPVGLAWYGAAQRSWLPTVRKLYRNDVMELRYSSDGLHLISTGVERQGTQLSELQADELEADSLRPVRRLAHIKDQAAVLIFAPDFKTYLRMVGTMDGGFYGQPWPLELCDVTQGKRIWEREPPLYSCSIAISPRGKWLTAVNRFDSFGLLSLQGGYGTVLTHYLKDFTNSVVCAAAFSSDERLLAAQSTKGQLCLWDTATGQLRHTCQKQILPADFPTRSPLLPDEDAISKIAISPNKRWVASNDAYYSLSLWDVDSHLPPRAWKVTGQPLRALAFAPDSATLASGDSSGTITLWDVKTGTKLRALTLSKTKVTALVWSPDGNFVFGGYNDGTIARWRVK